MTNLLLMSMRSPYVDDAKIYSPLGILYLKSAVNQAMPEVKVDVRDDYNIDNPDEFKGYDFIGLSVMTPQREEAKRVLHAIKERHPNTKVILGGPHALHYQKEAEAEPFDYIVPKDGQRSLLKILNGEAKRIEFDSMNPVEWAAQPRPDRTSPEAKEFLKSYHYTLQGRPAGTMLTATGCPMVCAFCEDAGTAVRWSPLEKLMMEMDDLTGLGYKGVYLFDDLFAIAINKVKPIAEELKKRDLIYRCNGQANFFTKWGEDFAKVLGETGCVEIAFGHESGSQKILDNVNKRTKVEQNRLSIQYAKKYGINVKSFLMLGLPGETRETMKDTENFIATAGMDDFQLAVYYPYKGTRIRDMIEMGSSGYDLFFEGEGLGAYGQKGGKSEAVVRTGELSSKDLLEFRDYLVDKYKPKSHSAHWKDQQEDKFFDTRIGEAKK